MDNPPLQVMLYDDKKQRHQSFEASAIIEIDDIFYDSTGYGSTPDEAINAYKEKLRQHVKIYQKALYDMDSNNYIVVNVNGSGVRINATSDTK